VAAAAPVIVPHAAGNPAGYRIKLERFVVPPNRIAGLLVKARINGGPPLTLLVDSGSQYVVLVRAAALHSHCAGGADFELVGAGAATATRAKRQMADTLELGDLTLRGVPLIVTDRTLAEGIQGVLPLAIFAEFLIRLDFPAKELETRHPVRPLRPPRACWRGPPATGGPCTTLTWKSNDRPDCSVASSIF
jgi:hypothetical protein